MNESGARETAPPAETMACELDENGNGPKAQWIGFRMTTLPLDVQNPIESSLIRLMAEYQGIDDSESAAPGMSSAIHHVGFGGGVVAR
jgi:hypothetical protein